MSKGTYRGVVKNGTIVLLDDAAELAEGTEVLVTPLPKPGDVAALLEAIRANPVPKEDAEELLRAIEEGPSYRPSARFLADDPQPESGTP
jgi:hypothetical protein